MSAPVDFVTTELLLTKHRANYDCVVGNVVAGANWLGCNADQAAASALSIEPTRSGDRWTLEASSRRQLAAVEQHCALTIATERGSSLPSQSGAAVLVGDGHDMPWTPYFGNERLEHSFLLVRDAHGLVAFDGYATETDWGPARPQAIATGTWEPVDIDRTESPRVSWRLG